MNPVSLPEQSLTPQMNASANPSASLPPSGLIRRVFAIVYDLFLLSALWFVASAVATALNHGEAIGKDHPYHLIFVSILLLISFFYYGWFWTHGGQTLGQKTWRIMLTAKSGDPVTWKQSLVYFLAALLSWSIAGLGFLWSLVDQNHATMHDRIAGCVMRDLR